ncbi:MAG: phosphoribosylglycinamide formyltransferase [Spirochaetes bacterium]|nr:phosphoribosylglycinamide formyltransferase [Spirochaetota bacterium]
MNTNKKNLAVFVSGTGTNFIAVQEAILDGRINGNIALLISSRPDAPALEKAKNYIIPSSVISEKDHSHPDEYANEILERLQDHKIDFIILAGFLKKIPDKVIKQYKHKIINIHPALLPKFGGKGMYGIHVHEAVIKAQEKETGVTVHFVDEEYDHGPTIMQRKVPVEPADTPDILQKRVLREEHRILPEVVELLCMDRIKIINREVVIDEKGE